MAEDLTDYLSGLRIRVKYLHSDIDTLTRVQILRQLRTGEFDVLIGINLLREGLDMPEVSLVAVLDADKEGFLRSKSSLMQVAGRAARNVNGIVILYADKCTDAMDNLIKVSNDRRKIQNTYNKKNGIMPRTIKKSHDQIITSTMVADSIIDSNEQNKIQYDVNSLSELDRENILIEMRKDMLLAAETLEFEKAAKIRDEITELEKL